MKNIISMIEIAFAINLPVFAQETAVVSVSSTDFPSEIRTAPKQICSVNLLECFKSGQLSVPEAKVLWIITDNVSIGDWETPVQIVEGNENVYRTCLSEFGIGGCLGNLGEIWFYTKNPQDVLHFMQTFEKIFFEQIPISQI
jgi:hypothetical protein